MPEADFILLGSLLVSAFLAATLLPGGSEAALAGLLLLRPELTLPAILVATLGNTAGGMSTYALGRLLPRKELPPRLELVRRYGSVSLVLSWLPLLGDGLCAAAGLLRLNGFACLVWMAIGKGARYLVLAWALT
ncbi:DedA family protein [Thauera humireducens]|jgi:membrane protein YqaA with SNARE-associated domain|uniref:YqaA family protein n=1 Tax=Thauera humireducens TaxID=1134435 RepID=UPI00311FBEFB